MAKTVSWRAIVALGTAVLFFPASSAQAAGEVDLGFDASPIVSAFGSANVFALLVLPDGRILVGGSFTNVQGVPRVGVARLHPDGTLDPTFVSPFSVTSESGSGMNVGTANYSLVRLLPDGTVDPSFTLLPMAVSYGIEAVCLLPDGRMMIGGDFSNIGPVFTSTMARLFPDGSRDPSFELDATTDGAGGRVVAITPQPDGNFLIGGEFQIVVGPLLFARLARVRPDSTVDTSFRPTFDLNEGPVVNRVVLRPDGSLYAAGRFSSINGTARVGVARLTTGGALDTAFGLTSGSGGAFHDVLRQPDGKLLVTGDFFLPPNRWGIARLDETGAFDGFSPPLGLGPGIGNALALQVDGKVLVGGPFFNPGGVVRERVVRLLNDPANTPPNAVDDIAATPEDVAVTVNVTVTDEDVPKAIVLTGSEAREPCGPRTRATHRRPGSDSPG